MIFNSSHTAQALLRLTRRRVTRLLLLILLVIKVVIYLQSFVKSALCFCSDKEVLVKLFPCWYFTHRLSCHQMNESSRKKIPGGKTSRCTRISIALYRLPDMLLMDIGKISAIQGSSYIRFTS